MWPGVWTANSSRPPEHVAVGDAARRQRRLERPPEDLAHQPEDRPSAAGRADGVATPRGAAVPVGLHLVGRVVVTGAVVLVDPHPGHGEVSVHHELRLGGLGEARRGSEVVDVGVGDHHRVHVAHPEIGLTEPVAKCLPVTGTGHPRIDDGRATIVEQCVGVDVAEPGHADRQLHPDDVVADLGHFRPGRLLLLLAEAVRLLRGSGVGHRSHPT